MLQRIRNVKYTGDPAILPAHSNEITFLVRLLYKISKFLNDKVSFLSREIFQFEMLLI